MPNPVFDRVIIIMFENEFRSYVMQNPYMAHLASQGIDMVNYFGVMHPSQTNYISSIAGELCGVFSDAPPSPLLTETSIVDLIEAGRLDWRAYMESYRSTQSAATSFPYVQKHDPFSSIANIVYAPTRLAKIVDLEEFWLDVANNSLPQYSWITPNMWNDGHYRYGTTDVTPAERAPELVDNLAHFLQFFFGELRFPGPNSRLPQGTLVVVTFDEADFEAAYDPKDGYQGPNQIYTVLLGDMIQPGRETGGYNHYSLLKTVEKNWGLGSLGKNDAASNWLRVLWDEKFSWSKPQGVDGTFASGLAAAKYNEQSLVVYQDSGGRLLYRTYDAQAGWSAEKAVGQYASGTCALAASGDSATLVYRTPGSFDLLALTYQSATGWSEEPVPLGVQSAGAIAMCAFTPPGGVGTVAPSSDLMFVYPDQSQALHSMMWSAGAWGTPTSVGYTTDGDIALSALGGSIYLVYKVVGHDRMNSVLYNAAPFNVVTPGPSSSNTVVNAWSASSYQVGHYRGAKDKHTPGEPEPKESDYQITGAVGMAELDGEIHLVYPHARDIGLQTTVFSFSGVMASELPTLSGTASSNISPGGPNNDGYGTLDEVGWSEQEAVAGAEGVSPASLAVCRTGSGLLLLYGDAATGSLRYAAGGFSAALSADGRSARSTAAG
jgi:hypothetical protein